MYFVYHSDGIAQWFLVATHIVFLEVLEDFKKNLLLSQVFFGKNMTNCFNLSILVSEKCEPCPRN